MASIKSLVIIIAVLCISTKVQSGEGAVSQQIRLHEKFTLDFELKDENKTIAFVLEAKTEGWVGIGINYKTPTMMNADYFIGYVNNSVAYGGDYHIVQGESQPHARQEGSILHNAPTPDPTNLQNWNVISGRETVDAATQVTTTRLEISRSLNTTDAKYDHVITNSTLYLIWAFNSETDDVTTKHSVMGSEKINFLTGNMDGTVGDGDGGDMTDIGEEDDGGNGAAILSIRLVTLMLAIAVSVVK